MMKRLVNSFKGAVKTDDIDRALIKRAIKTHENLEVIGLRTEDYTYGDFMMGRNPEKFTSAYFLKFNSSAYVFLHHLGELYFLGVCSVDEDFESEEFYLKYKPRKMSVYLRGLFFDNIERYV